MQSARNTHTVPTIGFFKSCLFFPNKLNLTLSNPGRGLNTVDAQPSTSTISDPCSERLPSRFVYTSTPEQSNSPGVAVRD